MPKRLLVLPLALTLSACGASTRTPPPSAYIPPSPPPAATQPCTRTAIETDATGGLTSAGAEAALRARDIDLARCEARRAAAIAAWPE